jgi:Protein of unknown function (DUF3429)
MPTRTFWLISASGLVPFLVCLAIAYRTPDVSALHDAAIRTFLVYAALTLSFLGGARWGAELARSPDAPKLWRMAAAASPTLVGLAALLPQAPLKAALGLLMLSSGMQLAWDVAASREGLLPPWNARVRTVLTVAGTLCSLALWPAIA